MTNYFDKLPEFSFSYLPTTGEVIMIKRGEEGYFPQPNLQHRTVDELNELYDVTKAQAEAMQSGSMYGWHVPASNPELWEKKLREGLQTEEQYLHNALIEKKMKMKEITLSDNSTCCSNCFEMLEEGEKVYIDEDNDVICKKC